MVAPLLLTQHVQTNPTHYGNPTGGCESDEEAISVEGVTVLSSGVFLCSCSRPLRSVAAAIAELDCVGFVAFSISELGLTSMVDLGCLFLSQRLAWYGLPTQYIQ